MKKFLLFSHFCFGILLSQAQLPNIHATTIIPQSPGPNDVVKVVTRVTTPNQGIVVDLIHTVSHNPKEINLKPCYWQGMLTAIQTHIDTFVVGKLQPGVYTLKHKAYMSTTQQHCTKIDSNMVVSTVTVSAVTTDLKMTEPYNISVYPNPVKDKLYFNSNKNLNEVEIYQLDGKLVRVAKPDENGTVNVEFFAKGLYFVRFLDRQNNATIKFIKE